MVNNTRTRWCLTLNNYTPEEEAQWTNVLNDELVVRYGIFGREVGAEGTPHLQGFVILQQAARLNAVKALFGDRIHAEFTQGTSKQAAEYCKKEGNYSEYGTFPGAQGKRTDIDEFVDWVKTCDKKPNQRTIANQFPTIWVRYPRVVALVDHIWPPPNLLPVGLELNEWQQELDGQLRLEPDDRSILFVVDAIGSSGKSMFVRHQLTMYPEETQVVKLGKRDDLAYAIDPSKRVFLFDIPRLGMEYFQYNVVEQIKDRIVFSSKYQSQAKVLDHDAHVVVLCNEQPDQDKMTLDRFKYFDVTVNY
jgi:hypothetical protein